MIDTKTELPPIVTISSEYTHATADLLTAEVYLERKGATDSRDVVAFAIEMAVRQTYPYGMWTCFDGKQYLFNREYQPILKKENGVLSHCDRNEWVNNDTIKSVQYFYGDHNSPMLYLTKHLGQRRLEPSTAKSSLKSLKICMNMLREFTPLESTSVSRKYSISKQRPQFTKSTQETK